MKMPFFLIFLIINTFASAIEFSAEEKEFLKEKKIIRMCIDPNWEPLEYFDENKVHSGFSADYMRLIENKIGIPIQAIYTKSWSDSEKAFYDRQCDLLPSIAKIQKRLATMSFTPPIITVPNVIIGNNKQNKIDDMSELEGKKIGVVNGYAYADILAAKYPKLKLTQVSDSKVGLLLVSTNQLDFMIDFVSATSFYIDKLSLSNVRYVGKTEGMDLALSIGTHIDQVILSNILTKAVNSIPKNEVEALKKKWINSKLSQDYSSLFKILIISFILVVLLLLWSITLKRAVELKTKKLLEKENYSRMLFEASPVALALCDMNGVLIDINPAYCSLIGYTKQEAIKLSYWDLTPKSYEGQEAAQLESLNKNKKYGPYEKEYIHKNGKHIPVKLNGQIIERDGKKYIWSSIEDITESKAHELRLKDINTLLEQKVKERTIELEKASEAKSHFLATMSHELRTPLNGILGPIDLLKNMQSNTDEQKELLDIAKSSAQQMYVIVNDILDFTKIESGALTFEKIDFSLIELINNITQMFKPQIKEKNILIKVNIDDNLSDSFVGDPTRLTQILLNLVNNAVKFTPKGVITISVSKFEKNHKQYTAFSVIDTGIGIEKEKLSQIFQPFVQADSSTTRFFGGTGLGLSIVKKLVELQNGKIECQSELNKGSTFKFYLPLLKYHREVKTNIEESITTQKISSLDVLVVEDNSINQIVAKKLLQKLGHKVTIVKNGHEAIAEVKNNKHDLILMDWRMPGMDGIEATKIIRTMDKPFSDIPIIGLTANVFEEDIKTCIASGMNDVIKKPVTIQDLSNAISRNYKMHNKI